MTTSTDRLSIDITYTTNQNNLAEEEDEKTVQTLCLLHVLMQPEVASIYYLSTCWYSAFCLDTLKSGRFGVMAKMASSGRGGASSSCSFCLFWPTGNAKRIRVENLQKTKNMLKAVKEMLRIIASFARRIWFRLTSCAASTFRTFFFGGVRFNFSKCLEVCVGTVIWDASLAWDRYNVPMQQKAVREGQQQQQQQQQRFQVSTTISWSPTFWCWRCLESLCCPCDHWHLDIICAFFFGWESYFDVFCFWGIWGIFLL